MRELFVYYRVPSADAGMALAEVSTMHSELRALFPFLRARLLRRPDESDGMQTWMETYAVDATGDAAGIDTALQAEIETRAARRLTRIEGRRHVEAFIDCVA